MALPTLSDIKAYLRIETTAEDALLTALLARAQAQVEVYCDVPITAASSTFVDEGSVLDRPLVSLVFPRRPIGSVSVTDADGVTVPASSYRVNASAGMIIGNDEGVFVNAPYTITCQCGLSLRPDYARIEPIINQLILDLAADLYQRRTPSAASESAAGTSVSWDTSREASARALKAIRALKLGIAL